MDIDKIVENIQKCCLAHGIKPTVACRESGIGKDYLTNLKKGRTRSISIGKLQSLADYLGVTTSELLGEKKNGSGAVSNADGNLTEMERLFLSLPAERREEVLRYMKYLATQSDDN